MVQIMEHVLVQEIVRVPLLINKIIFATRPVYANNSIFVVDLKGEFVSRDYASANHCTLEILANIISVMEYQVVQALFVHLMVHARVQIIALVVQVILGMIAQFIHATELLQQIQPHAILMELALEWTLVFVQIVVNILDNSAMPQSALGHQQPMVQFVQVEEHVLDTILVIAMKIQMDVEKHTLAALVRHTNVQTDAQIHVTQRLENVMQDKKHNFVRKPRIYWIIINSFCC